MRINDIKNLEKLDTIILKFISTSLLNDQEFIKEGQILNQKEQRYQIIKKLDGLSNHLFLFKYYNSFADNEQEITDGILSFMKQNHLQLSLPQFRSIEPFALELGLDIDIYEKSLLEKILKETSEPDDLFELRNTVTYPYFGQKNLLIKYPDLEASLKEKIHEYYQTLDITTALQMIIIYDRSNPKIEKYIEFLKSRTVDEYCKWLKKGHPELLEMVRWLLNSGDQPASQNLEKAIRILAECSRINKIRAKNLYRIDIDN